MKATTQKIAAILAFIIGVMAVFAGGRVLLGGDPGYYVINWLVLYNYTLGILTVALTAGMIWSSNRLARPLAVGTLGIHALVLVILLIAYRDVVAPDSLVAMTVRIVVWAIILGLLFFKRSKKEAK